MKRKALGIFIAGLLLTGCAAGKGESSSVSTADTAADTTASSAATEATEATKATEATEATEAVATTTTATSVSSAEPETSTDDPEVQEWDPYVIQRQVMLDEGDMCGVAYIGYVESGMTADDCRQIFLDSTYAEDFEDLTDIPDSNIVTECGGCELYLIIPQDVGATVSVNEWLFTEENDFMGEAGRVYYRSESGAPVLVCCNVSDIMPNIVVSIVDSDGRTLEWSPSISLKDGSVLTNDLVHDFTYYDYNETYESYSPVMQMG